MGVSGSNPGSRSHAVLAQLVEALLSGGRISRFESAVRHVDEVAEQRPTKQVIVIRRDLKMRRGKEIAQGAHASLAWLAERVIHRMTPTGPVDHVELSEAERAWLESSFRKLQQRPATARPSGPRPVRFQGCPLKRDSSAG